MNTWKNRVKNTLLLLLVLFTLGVLPRAAYADSPDYRVPVNEGGKPADATYILPGEWNSFYRNSAVSQTGNYYYYTASQKAGTAYWAHVNVLFPRKDNNTRASDNISIYLGYYTVENAQDANDGFTQKNVVLARATSNKTYYVESDTYNNFGSAWVRIPAGSQVIVKVVYNNAGAGDLYYRFSLDLVEDHFPEAAADINNSHTFRRGAVIQDFIDGDSDYIRFETDSNTLYRISIKSEELNPNHGVSSVYLKPFYNGKFCPLGLTPEVDGSCYFLTCGSGYTASDGSTYFLIQLKPDTTYDWGILGNNCKYEVRFEPVSLNDLKLNSIIFYEKLKTGELNSWGGNTRVYSGSPLEPILVLQSAEALSFNEYGNPSNYHTIKMQENVDYKVDSYKSNDKPGTAYVVLKGIGNVTGTLEIPFTILPDPSAPETPETTKASETPGATETPAVPKKGTNLKHTGSNGKYKVVKAGYSVAYTGMITKKSSVKIPDTVKINNITYRVVSIAANALKNQTKVKSVTIGKYVTSIGKNAFYNCSALTTLKLGSQVKTIGAQAFMKCTSLKTVTIPASVTSVGTKAFYGDKKLATVTIKSTKLTDKKVGKNAFGNTSAKSTAKVPAKVKSAYKKWLTKKGIKKVS